MRNQNAKGNGKWQKARRFRVVEKSPTFEEKISDCFEKINIRREAVNIGDLMDLKNLHLIPQPHE